MSKAESHRFRSTDQALEVTSLFPDRPPAENGLILEEEERLAIRSTVRLQSPEVRKEGEREMFPKNFRIDRERGDEEGRIERFLRVRFQTPGEFFPEFFL